MIPAPRYDSSALSAAVRDVLRVEGLPDHVASVEAELMVEADLCGVPSHGVVMLPKLVAGISDGRVTPDPAIRLLRDHGATALLDGDHGPGRFVSSVAMDHALEKAQGHGIGACAAVRTTHWGRAHAYACQAARRGLVGLCTTNAIPTVTVPGVPRAVLGNNPLAIAAPRAGGDPVVLDLAMTQAAFGKVATHRREGRPIPGDWGVDAEGRPTRDAAAILASGLLLPMGGHKGIGLALMMELLTAALAGGPFAHEIARSDATGLDPGATKLFLAIDPGVFGDRSAFEARVDAMLDYLKSVEPEHPLVAPGGRGWAARRENLRDGVPIHPDIAGQLQAVGVVLPAPV